MGQAVLFNYILGWLPDEEVKFDGGAVFVVADIALTLVTAEVCRGGIGVLSCADYSVEVHVSILRALQVRPMHDNLVVTSKQ